ncbi:MAG: ABC transporter substrate-binding protein [Isosphaeraceae bacterium]
MSRPQPTPPRRAIAAWICLLGAGALSGPLARGQDLSTPPPEPVGAKELLRSEPFDRITLIDNTILIVDPVSPRPLPVLDPRKERERRLQGVGRTAATPIEVGADPKKLAEETRAKEQDALEILKIHLLVAGKNENRDFLVKRSSIKKVEYFEDILIAEADRLTQAREYTRAFECCARVAMRNPKWAGLEECVNRLLFNEGRRALIDGDDERGLRLLRELLDRKRDYPNLLEEIGQAYGKRIERAVRMNKFLQGRRVLHELEEVTGEIAAVKALRSLFTTRAAERMREGESAAPPERLDSLVDALRIWPTLPGAEERYIKAFEAEPTLDVGVTDVAYPLGPWIHSRADARIVPLLYRPVLASDDIEAREGKRPGQLAAAVETTDLGRRLIIRLRPGPQWSDRSRPVSAIDVAQSLIERTDPHSPTYEARWADLLDRVEVREERIEVRLNHTPLKVGGWLLAPVGPAHAGIDGCVALSAKQRLLVTDNAFRSFQSTPEMLELRTVDERSPGESEAAPRIRRVREVRLSTGLAAVQALRRGDVAMIDHVPPDQVASLAEAPDVQVGRYTQPVLHVIAIDGRNPALRNRALRRGLSSAIDRKGLLEDFVLKHPLTDLDQPAAGPFPKGNYADAPNVKPLAFNILLAKMLVAAAKKDIGTRAIHLTFEYPAIPEVRVAVAKIIEVLKIAGVEIEPIELPESRLETELRSGRRFDLAYRVIRVNDPVLEAGPILSPCYDAPPDVEPLAASASPRILQLLLQLERAGDWPTSRSLAIQVDRESRDELPVIPLWQLADHYAWRSRIQGPGQSADRLYQGLESWQIAPWVAHDPWEADQKPKSK